MKSLNLMKINEWRTSKGLKAKIDVLKSASGDSSSGRDQKKFLVLNHHTFLSNS